MNKEELEKREQILYEAYSALDKAIAQVKMQRQQLTALEPKVRVGDVSVCLTADSDKLRICLGDSIYDINGEVVGNPLDKSLYKKQFNLKDLISQGKPVGFSKEELERLIELIEVPTETTSEDITIYAKLKEALKEIEDE